MSRKNVFLYDIDVPESVQEKAEIAFSIIRTEGDKDMIRKGKEERYEKQNESKRKEDKQLQKGRGRAQGGSRKRQFPVIAAAVVACAAVIAAAVGLKEIWNRPATDIAKSETDVEGIPVSTEKEDEGILSAIDNMFTLQVSAAELEEGQPVPLVDNAQQSDNDSQIDGRQADSWVMDGTEDGGLDYCINLPLSCKGNNIAKVTYSINQGAFQIVQPKDESILIDSQPYSGELNTGQIGGDYNEETGEGSRDYETVFYQAFTLDYQKQSDPYTWINICNELSGKTELCELIWGEGNSLEEINQGMQGMLDHTVITCTVQYQDGTTQSADILVNSRIMTCEEAGAEAKEDPNREEIFITFELQ